MKKLFAITALALGLALGGCSTPFGQKVEGVVSAITGATVSPQAVIVASNVFDGLERTATNYLRLKRCNGTNGPICRDPGATKALIPAIRSGRVARDNLQQFMKDHPGQLGPSGLYDALQTSINTLQAVFAQYNVGAGQ
jgi:hypothetical protein